MRKKVRVLDPLVGRIMDKILIARELILIKGVLKTAWLLCLIGVFPVLAEIVTRPPGLMPNAIRLADMAQHIRQARSQIAGNYLTRSDNQYDSALDLLTFVLTADPFHKDAIQAMNELIQALIQHGHSRLPNKDAARFYWFKARDLMVQYRIRQSTESLDALQHAMVQQDLQAKETAWQAQLATMTDQQQQVEDELKNEIAQLKADNKQLTKANQQMKKQRVTAKKSPLVSKRGQSGTKVKSTSGEFTKAQMTQNLKKQKIYTSNYSAGQKAWSNDYVLQSKGKVVLDKSTQLMWQQGGSGDALNYANVNAYVKRMNDDEFAGYKGWRLPTMAEAATLIEKTKENGGLYISDKFSAQQRWIWTSDKLTGSYSAWYISFNRGGVYWNSLEGSYYVRLCRSAGQ